MPQRIGLLLLRVLWSGMAAACQAGTTIPFPPASAAQTRSPADEPATPVSDEQDESVVCFSPAEILPIAFTPEDDKLLIRSATGVQVIHLLEGKPEAFIESPQAVVTAALSPDGQILAWSLPDGRIQLIRLSDRELLADLLAHPDPVYDLRFSAAGDRLYSASHDGVVRVWGPDGQLLASIETGGEVVGIGLSADGAKLATIPSDGAVQLWDLPEGGRIAELGGTGGYDTSDAHFSQDGQYLAADLATGLFLWRISDGELLWHEVENSMAVAFSPEGKYLAYSDIDHGNQLVIASPNAARVIRLLDPFQGPVWEMFFSPDGALLAATDGVEIRISRVEDGALLYVGRAACP